MLRLRFVRCSACTKRVLLAADVSSQHLTTTVFETRVRGPKKPTGMPPPLPLPEQVSCEPPELSPHELMPICRPHMSAPQCKGLVDGRQCKRRTWDPSGYCCAAHEAQQHDNYSGYVLPQQQHSQLSAECSQLKQLLQTSQNELRATQDSCKQQISILHGQLSAGRGDLTSCKERLRAAEEAAEKARLQLEEKQKELDKLKGQLQAVHVELEKLKAAHVGLAKEAAEKARLQLEEKQKELDKLKGQLQAAHVELEKLTGQLQAAHVELEKRGLQPLPAVPPRGAEGGT